MTGVGGCSSGRRGVLASALLVLAAAAGCARTEVALPPCEADQRLAIVAQSVPAAAYVPCVEALPEGWSLRSLEVDSEGTAMSLASDRAEEPVEVSFVSGCDPGGATPIAPRAEGVRTLQALTSISPRYAGRLFDVFPGGCVVYAFDFDRGAHIPLTEQLLSSVSLYSRRQLRQELADELGVTLAE